MRYLSKEISNSGGGSLQRGAVAPAWHTIVLLVILFSFSYASAGARSLTPFGPNIGRAFGYLLVGDGNRAVLTVSFERRTQFTKSGTTFEKIQFELVWSPTGNSGHTKKVLPMMNRPSIGCGTLKICRAFVSNAFRSLANFPGV